MSDTLLISTPTELLRLTAENVLFISSNGKTTNDKRQKKTAVIPTTVPEIYKGEYTTEFQTTC